ncbi:uncharacterized protein LOC119293588 [Triticum dicoccoides]|uniref:uncharacterized protein LOC119293588 n=1 Tax=Triticum dicoccoides TaxID=85692 RepID=UPI00188F2949|nr:uncharacterized protein LOC119293588 [Triticum dicoccoides]
MPMFVSAPETVTTTRGQGVGVSDIARVGPLSFGHAVLWFWKLPFPSSPSSSLQFGSRCFWLFLEFRFKLTMERSQEGRDCQVSDRGAGRRERHLDRFFRPKKMIGKALSKHKIY